MNTYSPLRAINCCGGESLFLLRLEAASMFLMSCPPALQTTMDETGVGFSLQAAWNKRFSLYQCKLKLDALNPEIGKFPMRRERQVPKDYPLALFFVRKFTLKPAACVQRVGREIEIIRSPGCRKRAFGALAWRSRPMDSGTHCKLFPSHPLYDILFLLGQRAIAKSLQPACTNAGALHNHSFSS